MQSKAISASRFKLSKTRSEEHTSELQSPVPISYAVFCLKKKKKKKKLEFNQSINPYKQTTLTLYTIPSTQSNKTQTTKY